MNTAKESMWLPLVVVLLSWGAMMIVAPNTAWALSSEELDKVVEEIKHKEEAGEVSSKEANVMLEELKEAVEEGDISYDEKEERDVIEDFLDDPQERIKAVEKMLQDKEKILAEGDITPEEFDRVLQAIREETDPEKFATVMREVFEKDDALSEDHDDDEDHWKEFIGAPSDNEEGIDVLREAIEKHYGDEAEERFHEIGLSMEHETQGVDFEDMTPDQQWEMAEKMGVTREEFEKYHDEGHEAMERMAREHGFDRETMEREMMEREGIEYERPPVGDYQEFTPHTGADSSHPEGSFPPPPGG